MTPNEPRTNSTAPTREPDYSTAPGSAAHKLIEACILDARNNSARKDRDRQDWENLLFHRGGEGQWAIWDRGTDRYVERGHDPERGGLPAWIPRPVTNVFANKIDGIAAILDQADPAKEFGPATDDDGDLAAAEVAEHAMPVLLEEIEYTDLKARATPLVCLTNMIVFVPYYDTDPKYGVEEIPGYQCLDCDVLVPANVGADEEGNALPCETCGKPYELAVNGQGATIGFPEPVGKICCDLVPGFEASLPKHARAAHAARVPWILFHTRIAVEEIKRRWEGAKDLDLATKSRPGASGNASGLARHFADAMALLSSPRRANDHRGSEGLNEPVVYRLQHDPIETDDYYFPDGAHITMVDDRLVEVTPLPVKKDDGRRVKNAVIWQFQSSPGTSFGKPPADDLVPLQRSRNTLEALAELITMHDAAPTLFVPLSVTLETERTGVPGETVYYRSTVPGEKPTMEHGQNVPESVFRQIELKDQKMDELSKLNSVLQGARPEGDPTLGEVEILNERAMSAFRPALNRLADVEKQLCTLLLYIARDSAWSPRFRRVMGDNGEWDIRQFVGADLDGGIDITIDPASAWPKSPLLQQANMKKAFEMGLFPVPVASDPELTQKILAMLNLANLKPSIDLDRKQVARKLRRWKEASDPMAIAPPDPVTENLPVHFMLLTNFLKSEEFELLSGPEGNPPIAQAMRLHVQMIGGLLQQQAMAAAAAEAGVAAPGGPDPLDDALNSGALRPAGGEPEPADPLDGMVASGALVPADAAAAGGPSLDDLIAARALTPIAPEAQGPPM